MSRSKNSQIKVTAAENRQKAFDYRKMGVSYRDIAKNLNVSVATAHKYVSEELARIAKDTAEKAEELRTMEGERLDRIFRSGFEALVNGDLKGADVCLKAMDRRARLYGLDAAIKQEINGNLLASGEWNAIKGAILDVLDTSPDLKKQFLSKLEELNA